jgi:hypothetical protein
MSRPRLDIHPEPHSTSGLVNYNFDLRYSGIGGRQRLSYEIVRQPETRVVEVFDGVLCATVLHAMAEGRDIHLHGPASETILANLREFQLAWARWLPETYRPVDILVDRVVAPQPSIERRCLAAFSGGVDSLFTVLQRNRGTASLPDPVHGALMVHGFDVGLDNGHDFQELVDRTAEVREALGLSLRVVRTNSKKLHLQTWAYTFAAELAACMHFCSAEFSTALIGSSEPYDALVLPWGSNPITDHLLSGGALRIVHDGAAFSRTEKVAVVARFPYAARALKVCWEGRHQGRNCGVCEKCVRTRLNFLAVGVAQPPCFDGPLDLGLIPELPITSDAVLAEFRSICAYAERHGVRGEWLRLLRVRLRRHKRDRDLVGLKETSKGVLDRLRLLQAARVVRRGLIGNG